MEFCILPGIPQLGLRPRSWHVWLATAIAVGGVVCLSKPARRVSTVAQARAVAQDPRKCPARISGVDLDSTFLARTLPEPKRFATAAALAELADGAEGDDRARMLGLAHFIAGKGQEAALALASIQEKSADDWNDLAAAEILREGPGEERWTSALVAVDHALLLNGDLAPARFNRAVVLDHFGLTAFDPTHWPTEGQTRWGEEARRRARASESAATPRATKIIERAPLHQLEALTRRYPQDARSVGEGIFLSHWAEGAPGDPARASLDRARMIGKTLQSEFGESLLADAVAAIDGAPQNALARLRSGHLAYREGRQALNRDELAAERSLRKAQRELDAAGSPMAALAEEYLATAYVKQNRQAEALKILTRLRAEARARPDYRALLARIQHDVALCEAQRGRWSASLEAAREAVSIWTLLRDAANASAAEAIVSEDYDFLGQRELAWKHGVSALRKASSARHENNARGILGVLTRTEMRAARWESARAIARLEEGLRGRGPGVRPDLGLLLRIAAIEFHLGDPESAQHAIDRARSSAGTFKNPRIRAKLLADVEATAGAIAAPRNPEQAAALLSQAIVYQQQSARDLVLPELYLARARARLAFGALDDAGRDLDAGIAELERQRDHVDESELRPGLFDSSATLFHEAVALQLQRGGEPARVLSYIERGRARAMLDQIGESRRPPALADVQRRLGPGMVLLEYLTLPDRLVIVAVTSKTARIQVTATSPAQIEAATNDYALLYEMLIRPVADVLRGARAVTFVPDDSLQRVPFAALLDRQSRTFLIQHHVLATAPSAGVAMLAMERAWKGRPSSALVFANPTIPRDTDPDLESLRTSEREAAVVARSYRHPALFQRDDATAERFLALAPGFDIVHFAGHAVVERAEPAASALVCASSPEVHGRLTLRQVAAMRFERTRVVVLAACSTMTGRNAAIEGVSSLARAFVVAGVPAVVGTLWDIDDAEAAPIMRALHEELARGADPGDALRAAQLAAIRDGRPVHQWAAFAVTGVAR